MADNIQRSGILIQPALELAKQGLPVFPTNQKKPVWSNKELGLEAGQGGYKIATTDPSEIRRLFNDSRATEIAVPMGEMSGLLCVDVDDYKRAGPDLVELVTTLEQTGTRVHGTRSGGRHYIFEHPGDAYRMPATLMESVDLKANGNGYVCWPGTPGYEVMNPAPVQAFPLEILRRAMKAKGGSGSVTFDSWNDLTNQDLVDQIKTGESIYPALRSLSVRLANSTTPQVKQVSILREAMHASDAADAGHRRHDDWTDRFGKIVHLVKSANAKQDPLHSWTPDLIAEVQAGQSFIDTQKVLAAAARPIGPQRETTAQDIEARLAAETTEDEDGFTMLTQGELSVTKTKKIEWLVQGVIPAGNTLSLAGSSNVGKTRWMALLLALASEGKTDAMGLPSCEPFSSVWVANEEHVDDIARRLKAVQRLHGNTTTEHGVYVTGKGTGMFRLVAMNETRTPEVDEEAVARLVKAIRKVDAKLVVLDPYITLATGLEENSAESAAVLTKAFILIQQLTGAAVMHVHHTPKSQRDDGDWYKGSADAWRGSGAIYSGLDCGFTLAPWMPTDKEQRKAWKDRMHDDKLGRWVTLHTGKIREGEPLAPIVYELVGQSLGEGQDEIGVCRTSNQQEAADALLQGTVDTMAGVMMADQLFAALGHGDHSVAACHAVLGRGVNQWPNIDRIKTKDHFKQIEKMFGAGVVFGCGRVQYRHRPDNHKTERHMLLIEGQTDG